MFMLRSPILLSAVVIALLSSSSLTTRADDTVQKPQANTAEAATPTEKPTPTKPLYKRIGAGEMGIPQNKLRDSWINQSESTSSEKTTKDAKAAAEAEMKKSIATRDSSGEVKTSASSTNADKIKESQRKLAERKQAQSQSGNVPKWKQNLAAKKAEEAKKADAQKKDMPPLKSTYEEKAVVEHKPVDLKLPLKVEQGPETVEHKLKMPPLKVEQGPETVEHKPVELKLPLKVEQGPETVEHKPVELKMPPLKVEQGPEKVEKVAQAPSSTENKAMSEADNKEQARLDKAMNPSKEDQKKKDSEFFRQRRMELEAKLKARQAEAPAN
jgi:hypothetical protein